MEVNLQRAFSPPSDGCNTIDESMQMVKKKFWRKKRPKPQEIRSVASSIKSERFSISTLKPTSSSKSMLTKSTTSPSSCIKMLSAPGITHQNKRTASMPLLELDEPPPEKYSRSLFSADESAFSVSEPRIFSRTRDCGLSTVSATNVNETFLSGYEERLQNQNPQIMSHYQLERDLEELSRELTPRNSQRQQIISPIDDHYLSDDPTLNQAFESPVHELLSNCDFHDSESEHRSEVNGFVESVDECFRSQHSDQSLIDQQDYQTSVHNPESSEDRSEVNEFEESVNERLRTQYMTQRLINQQNHQISMQLQNFECFVRDKIDAAEEYVKKKLTQIEVTNLAVVEALNGLKCVKRDEPDSRNRKVETKSTTTWVMPKMPISKDFSLAILNSALKNVEYMDQFVSEISHIVKLNAYDPKKTIKSIMTKLFTFNLLIKYKWSQRTSNKCKKPAFSSLSNVLRAIATLLTSYMSEHDMRRQMEDFFMAITRLYKNQKLRYF